MKRNIPAFLSGALTTALVGTIAVSALAASGRMTITVDSINVQVNGEVFQPRDANGNDVPVFSYNGTTYAPLRALAEAYGLEVGYDRENNMATVVDPEEKPVDTPSPDTTAKTDYSDWSAEDEAAYQEFKGMWEYTPKEDTAEWIPTMTYIGTMQEKDLVQFLEQYEETILIEYAVRAHSDFVADSSTPILHFRTNNNRGLFSLNHEGTITYGSIFSSY